MAEATMAGVMLESARRDAAAYQALVRNAAIHDSILGFHAQQVVEKAMKATLFKHGVLVPRTHNIAQLLDVLDDAAIPAPPHADEIDSLNPYAVQARYGTLDAGSLDRQVVEVWVNEVLAWAGLQVSGAGSA
jgi:HEPN domain-containing protein